MAPEVELPDRRRHDADGRGVVFFGDIGGNFYALDAANGQKLWGQELGGAIGGGVITYTANGAQKVAGGRPYAHRLANEDRDRQDRSAGPRRPVTCDFDGCQYGLEL